MQQATQINEQAKPAAVSTVAPIGAANTSFVINLCSSTSPVALTPPDHAGLKRFTFFVSRRREEGRERFRLHMGYFVSQEEAEKLLDIVREIYPGAWAGLAPGQRLRAAAAAAAAAQAPAAEIEQEVEPAAVAKAPVATVSVAVPVVAPPLAAVPAPAPLASIAAPAPVAVSEPLASRIPAVEEEISFQLLPDDGARRRPAPVAAVEPPKAVEPTPQNEPISTKAEAQAATNSLSNVRAAIASLADSTGQTAVLKPPADLKIPELKAAVMPLSRKPADKQAPAIKSVEKPVEKPAVKPVAAEPEVLNDAATLAVLEDEDAAAAKPAKGKTGAAPVAEKPCYAVQLIWSVTPIAVSQVPQLAIFSAYTLYGAEGNRDGRRWYGLRLGFFTDAVSAKQVAHYVRSEFSTVSVVPVTLRERERAKIAAPSAEVAPPVATPIAKAITAAKQAPGALVSSRQFEFIEDKAPAATQSADSSKPAGPRPISGTAARTGGNKGAPGKRAKLRTPAQMAAKAAAAAKPKKLTLEETLEILGAGDLKVDDGRGELMNTESAANAASPKAPAKGKSSRLGKLFERLSERIGN